MSDSQARRDGLSPDPPTVSKGLQRRLFFALLGVALVPFVILLAGGALTLTMMVERAGTAGPWDAVAESGRTLIEAVDTTSASPAIRAAARDHAGALSSSVRQSRIYALVSARILRLLPGAALGMALVVAAFALLIARLLARGFARPITELVGWTGSIARGEPLPPPHPTRRLTRVPEIERMGTALRDMATELEGARESEAERIRMRSWTEMARRVAHEIKNPLTPMKLAVHALAQAPDRAEGGAMSDPVRILGEEIDRLDRMARSFSRLGRPPEGTRSSIDLLELTRATAARHEAADLPVVVTAAGPSEHLHVEGHLEALRGAVDNLVLNAVEATRDAAVDGGCVEIEVARIGTEVVISVEDQGHGIDPAWADRIWNPDVSTKRTGTGLGLPIVRQSVLAHGGSVAAGPGRGGRGARFLIRLPAESPTEGHDPQ